MTTVKLKVNESDLSNFVEVINKLDYTQIEEIENTSIQKGIFKENEKPSDFAGIWKGEGRALAEIREKSWKLNQ
jgi:ribosome biogenesis protein Nip4